MPSRSTSSFNCRRSCWAERRFSMRENGCPLQSRGGCKELTLPILPYRPRGTLRCAGKASLQQDAAGRLECRWHPPRQKDLQRQGRCTRRCTNHRQNRSQPRRRHRAGATEGSAAIAASNRKPSVPGCAGRGDRAQGGRRGKLTALGMRRMTCNIIDRRGSCPMRQRMWSLTSE